MGAIGDDATQDEDRHNVDHHVEPAGRIHRTGSLGSMGCISLTLDRARGSLGFRMSQSGDDFLHKLVFSICMLKQMDRPVRHGWLAAAHSLSGRLLLLTLLFVMLSV